MKICPVGGELFPADGQIDMAKLIVSFRNIWNASKILQNACVCVGGCIVWVSEQTAIISLYINGLVFITGTECVSCAV
jgi:hypothetical protein